jgi:dolichol kinase
MKRLEPLLTLIGSITILTVLLLFSFLFVRFLGINNGPIIYTILMESIEVAKLITS